MVDNSDSSDDQSVSTNGTVDQDDASTDEPPITDSPAQEVNDDSDAIPLDLLVSSSSLSHDHAHSKESPSRDSPSQVESDENNFVSGPGDDPGVDGLLFPGDDIFSSNAVDGLDRETDGLDGDPADLISAYEETLSGNLSPSGKAEVLVQIGSTYWKKENDYKKAERFFRSVRNLDPTNSTMLDFYRSYADQLSKNDILINVLSAALNATREQSVRFELTKEVVSLTCANDRLVDRSIQLWKMFLRDYPDDPDATEQLKRIFIKYRKWNNLLAFINNQIKALSPTAVEDRKNLYREIIQIFGSLPEFEKVVIESYRLLFKTEPENKDVFDKLVAFYDRDGRWKNLIDLLLTRSSVTNDVDEESECLLRSAALQVEKFNNFSAAEEPLTRLIALDRHNLKAIEMLRRVYRHRRDWQKLFDLLERSLGLFEGERKLDAVLEMARTASSFSLSNTNTVNLWQTVLELDPENQEALNNLEKLCDRNENWDALVPALDNAILAATEDKQRVMYLAKKASIHSQKQKDLSAAIDAWKQILMIDRSHPKAFLSLKKAYFDTGDITGLEDLFIQSDDYKNLYDSLNALVNKTEDIRVKTALLKRCAELQLSVLNNRSKATQLLEKILSYEPFDLDARTRLLSVYRSNKQWKKFLNILDSILRDNEDYRYEFSNTDDFRTLEKQAEISQKWHVLVYLKQLQVDTLEDDCPERHELFFSIAYISEEKLKKYGEAVLLYKKLLSVSELSDRVISRMLVLLDQDSVKHDVAETLYGQIDSVSHDLVSLKILSILLEKTPPALDLADLRRRYDQEIEFFIDCHRSDPRTLFKFLLALLKYNHTNVSIRKTLFDLAGQLKRYDKLVDVLADIYNNSNLDKENELAYAEEIAEIYGAQLGKTDEAASYYRKIFDRLPGRTDIFEKLESFYKRSANWNSLLQVYDIAMKNEKDTRNLGYIADSIIATIERANIDIEERVYYLAKINSLDYEIEGVVDKLIEAYRLKADWKHLYEVVSRYLSQSAKEDEKEKYNLILADVCYRGLGNIDEAIKRHLSVLNKNPACVDSQKFFEELIGIDSYKSKAIEILKMIYRRRNDVAAYLRILEMELANLNSSDQERFSTTVEVALLYDNHLHNNDAAFDYITKAFVLDPTDEEVRNRMRSYAARAKSGKRYCEVIEGEIKKLRSVDKHDAAVAILFEYASYLSENRETKKALAIYWKMIDWYADNNAIMSRAINNIHSIEEYDYSPEDKIKLANIELGIEKDPVKIREILFRIAQIYENDIRSLTDAEAIYKKIIKNDGNNKDALQALSRIYQSEKQWNDLIETLKKLASIETSPKVKRDIFIRISKLATHM